MATSIYAFEMSSGQKLAPLPVSSGDWSVTANAADEVKAEVRIDTAVARKLQAVPQTDMQRVGLVAIVDNVPRAAGPILKRSLKAGVLSLTAGGFLSYLERRPCIPIAARETSLVDENGDPRASLDIVATDLSLGSIGRRYVEVIAEYPGTPPVVLPRPVAGTHDRTVKAIDGDDVASLLADLSDVEGGPDFAFVPRWSQDQLGIEWVMQHGSASRPRLGNPDASLIQWGYGAAGGALFDLEVEEEAGDMASEAWAIGGGSDDRVLAARSYDPTLLDAGYPLLQVIDSGNDSVTRQGTMQSKANQLTRLGRTPASFWKVSVRAGMTGQPGLGDYWLGDLVTVTVGGDSPYPLPGNYERRIAKIAGKVGQHHHDLTFAEALA